MRKLVENRFFRPLAGALLATLIGWVLWHSTLGDRWIAASYDYLFRFGNRSVTNNLVVVLMDNEAYTELSQTREEPLWDRGLHARLLNKLADDGCPLVALDVQFLRHRDQKTDSALAAALARLTNVVLAAGRAGGEHPGLAPVQTILPTEPFLSAAKTNWGMAFLDPDLDRIVRRHWPFPSPWSQPSLDETLAIKSGVAMDPEPSEKWIRYYGRDAQWTTLSYNFALDKPPGYFRGKTVFIGNKPQSSFPDDGEQDKFSTPYTRWTGEAWGGVEILTTCYVNLVKNEWLQRPSKSLENILLIAVGVLSGAGFCRLRRGPLLIVVLASMFAFALAAILLSYFTNFWIPWLIVVGGQIPCAFVCAVIPVRGKAASQPVIDKTKTIVLKFPEDAAPAIPDYELVHPPFGRGGFGKVWLARNAIGQWQAVKVVYQSKFGDDLKPYEAEFNGLQRYKPVSEKHSGLLRVELVSKRKAEGYFYYVMELGDSRTPDWERDPALYKPMDLESMRKSAPSGRLPTARCLSICIALAEALEFLHQEGLIHRDIKPSNVVFVKGRPKLADVGLVAAVRTISQVQTLVGTLGYMPPPPEKTGTVSSDIYSLGMLLYVISTGNDPRHFPELATTLMERSGHTDFLKVNAIIIKACNPEASQRYQTVSEMLRDLVAASEKSGE